MYENTFNLNYATVRQHYRAKKRGNKSVYFHKTVIPSSHFSRVNPIKSDPNQAHQVHVRCYPAGWGAIYRKFLRFNFKARNDCHSLHVKGQDT